MYHPTLEEFIELSKDYNLIPVYKEILADYETPVSAFQKLADSEHAFLLESVEGGERLGRYSFVGADPYLTATLKDGNLKVNGRYTLEGSDIKEPFSVLKEVLHGYNAAPIADLPPFYGGAVGFVSYDAIRYFENIPDSNTDDLKIPDVTFMFTDKIMIFDHLKHKIKVLVNVDLTEISAPKKREQEFVSEAIELYEESIKQIEAMIDYLRKPLSYEPITDISAEVKTDFSDVGSNVTKPEFLEMVAKAKEYIRVGDIFQVVVSQRFALPVSVTPLQIYRVLRTVNPSPYMYYLKFGDLSLVGSSPEPLVRVNNGISETRPIAGTRMRGKTDEEDAALADELLHDEKELAEHIMLVDLGRNDLGRVSKTGSVYVDELMYIEKYSHVQHIVSSVKGEVREDKTEFDVLEATFPAGTVSGAPKIRAMEIIDELESVRRGTYAGAVGYFGFNGGLDTCITIRTVLIKDGIAYVQAGAGIVADSDPESEYKESQNKAMGMVKAIKTAEKSFSANKFG